MTPSNQYGGTTHPTAIPTPYQHPHFPQLASVEPALSPLQTSVKTAKTAFDLNSNRQLGKLESNVTSRKQTNEASVTGPR